MAWTASVTNVAKDPNNGNILLSITFSNGSTGDTQTRSNIPGSNWTQESIAVYAQTVIGVLDARDAAIAGIATGAVAPPSGVLAALQGIWTTTTLPSGVTGAALASGDTAAQKLAKINAWTVAGPRQDVHISSIVGWLALNRKLASLQGYARAAVQAATPTAAQIAGLDLSALLSNPNGPAFAMSNPATYAAISAQLALLTSDSASALTAADQASLLALAETTIPWRQSIGAAVPISASTVAAAGLS